MAAPPSLSLLTYNVLAPCYYRCGGRQRESAVPERWVARLTRCIDAAFAADVDVLCFQEVWTREPRVLRLLEERVGHKCYWLNRSGTKEDGVAIVVRSVNPTSGVTVRALRRADVAFNSFGKRVALALLLEVCPTGAPAAAARRVVVCTTHLTFPHSAFDEKLRFTQAALLAELISRVAKSDGAFDARLSARDALRAAGVAGPCSDGAVGTVSCTAVCGDDSGGAAEVDRRASAGATTVPTIIAGDLNGEFDDPALQLLCSGGAGSCQYRSAFSAVHGRESSPTHCSHRGDHVAVDFALLKGEIRAVAARVLRSGSCDARGVLRRPPVEVDGSEGDVYESDHVALRFEFEL